MLVDRFASVHSPKGVKNVQNVKKRVLIKVNVKDKEFRTDVPVDKKNIFRSRSLAREFYTAYEVEIGDTIVYERTGTMSFIVKPSVTLTAALSERTRKSCEVLARPEQARFRREVAARDGWMCAVTGCSEPAALEAAHIRPVSRGGADTPDNGVLLRADIHRLFDAGLIAFDADRKCVRVHEDVSDPQYAALQGQAVSTGADLSLRESEAG